MKALVRLAAVVMLFVAWLRGAPREPERQRCAPFVRFVVKHPWFTAAVVAFVMMGGATVVLISGIVPIKASSGHWAITTRLLDFAKVRSVATHSLGIKPPELNDEALVLRGASHYAIGCEPCHGAPGSGVPPVMAAMTPHPPELTGEHLARWNARQLFSIVKHGIKFTGMPAWPAQRRDDEVWAMVAFLQALRTLDETTYRRLATGEAGAHADAPIDLPSAGADPVPRAVRDLCWRCHGVDGTGRGRGTFPSLAGQRATYLYAALRAFRERNRFSGTMGEIAARLDDGMMREVARYYERLPPRAADAPADASAIARGVAIATGGIPERDIPACVECHGPGTAPKNPAYPRLAGQHAAYLASQLRLLKERRRGGSARVNLMHVFVDRLGPEQIEAVTLYYGSTNATPAGPAVAPR